MTTAGEKKRSRFDQRDTNGGGSINYSLPKASEIDEFIRGYGSDVNQKRLYVGNLPPNVSQSDIIGFLNGALVATVGSSARPGNLFDSQSPVVLVDGYNVEARFCFVELRNLDYTQGCKRLDGIMFNNFALRIARPLNYVPPPTGDPAGVYRGPKQPGRGFLHNLPKDVTDTEIQEMLSKFGNILSVTAMRCPETGEAKGLAQFEFEDALSVDFCIAALNGSFLRGNTLRVTVGSMLGPSAPIRNLGHTPAHILPDSMTRKLMNSPIISTQVFNGLKIGSQLSTVVQLLNMVFAEDLATDEDHQILIGELSEEARKYGNLVKVVIPRPGPNLEYRDGVGKVFLQYADETSARKAQFMLNGRRFDGNRIICAAFFPEERFFASKYTLS